MRAKGERIVLEGRTLGFLRFGLCFGVYYDADEYALQFTGFFSYRDQSVFRTKSGFAEQFQPVLSFFQLLQRPSILLMKSVLDLALVASRYCAPTDVPALSSWRPNI